jgi:hypothetical protein
LPTERQDWFWVDPERISPKGWEYVNWKKGTLAGHPVRVRWEHVQQELATLAPNMGLDQRELPSGGSRPGRATARAGGAPPRHDWDAFWIEVALYAAKHDLDPDPAHRRDLQQHMVEWAARELDEATIRGRLSRLFQVVAANWRAAGAQLSR